MADDIATVNALAAIQNRQQRPIADAQRQQGVVLGINGSRWEVQTADGSLVYVDQKNVLTNGEIRNKTVLVTRPSLGQPFISAEIRG